MTPAEEKARLASVQLALELLLSGGPQTRKELFGESTSTGMREFQRRTLRALEVAGVVSKAETGTPPTSRIHLKNRKKAEYLLKNPLELVQVIWPQSAPAEPPEQFSIIEVKDPALEAAIAKAQEPEVHLIDIQPPKPVVLPPPPERQTDELMERLLVIMDAACQRIIYTSEQIDTMKKDIEDMQKKVNHLWEQLK